MVKRAGAPDSVAGWIESRPGRGNAGWRTRLLTGGVSVGAHVLVFLTLMGVQAEAPPPEPEVFEVALLPGLPTPEPPAPEVAPPAPDPPAATAPPEPLPPTPPPPRKLAPRPTTRPPPPTVAAIAANDEPEPAAPALLSEAQIAGAATAASSGGGGRACNMVQWLEGQLAKRPRVRAAVADAHRAGWTGGKPIWVWNGEWIRSPGQDGGGLAIVREALMWEIAFAPEACKADPVSGLVLVSLGDGGARVAMGPGRWRWSDLTTSRGAVRRGG